MSIEIQLEDDRYHRQSLITWWNQEILLDAKVLVVGAGALGNEIVKCLALTGIGQITVVDMDTIEHSNLARCVMFRPGDEGEHKAALVAARAGELNPDIQVTAVLGRVQEMGVGALANFDLVVGGLDNREARVWVNQACRKLGKTWIDGAIEGIRGTVRVFAPAGPCYECTLSEVDRKILSRRKSCALLDVDDVASGKVPTTATSASWVASVQAQEAIKILHGHGAEMALQNEGVHYVGETLEMYRVSYSEDEWCQAHDTYESLTPLSVGSSASLENLVERLDGVDLVQVVAFDLESDLVLGATCRGCNEELPVFGSAVFVRGEEIVCPTCGELMALDVARSIAPGQSPATRPLTDLRLPDRDVVTVRTAESRHHVVVEVLQ